MRIAFDASAMPARRAGAGVYMYRLALALADLAGEHELLLFDRHGAFDALAGRPGVTLHRVRPYGRAARLAWEQAWLPHVAFHWKADVLHGPHHALPLLPSGRAKVVTIHDITFDLLPHRYTRSRRWYMRAITRLGLLRADRVIVPSAFVQEALVRRYHVDAAHIHVVPEAAAPEMRRVTDAESLNRVHARYSLPERFVLSVGTREPGKNRAGLIRAMGELRRRGLPHGLVVVGGQGWKDDAAEQPGVTFTGYVPDEDLPALYSLADAFAFPSWLEGFGLPPLEALACGTPVVSSTRPAMPEVLGDAALYADPSDGVAWADALQRVLTDAACRDALIERGLKRAGQYSWERAARETVAVYAAALGE